MVSVDSQPTEETTKGGVVASRQLAAKSTGRSADGKPPAVSFLRWATFWLPVCVYPAAQARDQGLDHDPQARGRTQNPSHPILWVLRVLPSACLLACGHTPHPGHKVCVRVCVFAGALCQGLEHRHPVNLQPSQKKI